MKKTNNKFAVLIVFIVFIIIFFVFSFSALSNDTDRQHKIFSDIEALSILAPYETEKIEGDKYLGDLVPIESFNYRIKWEKKDFYVYAYVFEDDLQCMQYIKNINIPYYDNESWHLSGNVFFSSKYIVYSNNKVLYIDGPDEDTLMAFLDYIGQNFDILL